MEIKKFKIRENITPRGDGNATQIRNEAINNIKIRENITPRGDGNPSSINFIEFLKM